MYKKTDTIKSDEDSKLVCTVVLNSISIIDNYIKNIAKEVILVSKKIFEKK